MENYLRDYLELLIQLDKLQENDEDDERGDEIRDQMDFPGYQLTYEENALAAKVSAAFHDARSKKE